jgi:hypothetical protein
MGTGGGKGRGAGVAALLSLIGDAGPSFQGMREGSDEKLKSVQCWVIERIPHVGIKEVAVVSRHFGGVHFSCSLVVSSRSPSVAVNTGLVAAANYPEALLRCMQLAIRWHYRTLYSLAIHWHFSNRHQCFYNTMSC